MKVQMRKEAIQQSIIELGIETLEDAANRANCNLRTFRRAINGSPVQFRTAKRICEGLRLDPRVVLDVRSEEGKQKKQAHFPRWDVSDTEGIPLAECYAPEAARKVIRETLKAYDGYTREEVSKVLTHLLVLFGIELTANNPRESLFFIDEIAHEAKTAIYSEISVLESIANPHSSSVEDIKSEMTIPTITPSSSPDDVLERLGDRFWQVERHAIREKDWSRFAHRPPRDESNAPGRRSKVFCKAPRKTPPPSSRGNPPRLP